VTSETVKGGEGSFEHGSAREFHREPL
jgi:hypothetical protein